MANKLKSLNKEEIGELINDYFPGASVTLQINKFKETRGSQYCSEKPLLLKNNEIVYLTKPKGDGSSLCLHLLGELKEYNNTIKEDIKKQLNEFSATHEGEIDATDPNLDIMTMITTQHKDLAKKAHEEGQNLFVYTGGNFNFERYVVEPRVLTEELFTSVIQELTNNPKYEERIRNSKELRVITYKP